MRLEAMPNPLLGKANAGPPPRCHQQNAIQVSNAVIKTAPARQNLSRRNIIYLLKAVSPLSKRKPSQGSAADETALPGEGRESIAGADGEERLDNDPGEPEGKDRPDPRSTSSRVGKERFRTRRTQG